jgi:dipeptidyl aminopeptidase/acylaminoacyl peptidase
VPGRCWRGWRSSWPARHRRPRAPRAPNEPAPPGPGAKGADLSPATAPEPPTVLAPETERRDRARVPLAALVVDAYSNWNHSPLVARWSPDGKQILFDSQRGGSPQLYLADPRKPAAPAVALTAGTERAPWGAFAGDSIVFTRDHGADENFAIGRVQLDGSGLTNLTPGDSMHRDEPFLPIHAPGTMVYSASKTSEPSSHLFAQSTIAGGPRLVWIPVEYMVAANEGHSIDGREVTVEFLARVSRFLEDALGVTAPSAIH